MTIESSFAGPVCENCGNTIRQNRRHDKEEEGVECKIIDTETEKVMGRSRRRAKNLYRK